MAQYQRRSGYRGSIEIQKKKEAAKNIGGVA